MPRSPALTDWVALAALAAVWGLSFAFTEVALQSFPPATLVATRVIIAALILGMVTIARGTSLRARGVRWWRDVAVMAVLGTLLPFNLIAWGQQHIDSATAGVLMAVMPLFVVALAHRYVPGSTVTPVRAAGFGCGFVGVAMVIGPESLLLADDRLELLGMAAVLFAALSYAVNAVYAKRVTSRNPIATATGMMLVTSMLSLPGAVLEWPLAAWPIAPAAAVAMLFLGIVSTGVATVLFFKIIQGPGPTFLSLINYLIPACAVLAGAAFLGETLDASTLIGLALILAGVAVGELGDRIGSIRQALRSATATMRGGR